MREVMRDKARADIASMIYRPIDWEAFNSPIVQSEHVKLVELHIALSAVARNKNMRDELRSAILDLRPEAVPALVHGLQIAANFRAGFT